MRFKNLEGKPARENPKRHYLLGVDLSCYKWYQSQTLGDVPTRRLNPEGGWTQGSVLARTLGPEGSELGGPTSVGEGNECYRGCRVTKGGGL